MKQDSLTKNPGLTTTRRQTSKKNPYYRRQVLTESANIQRDGGHIYLQLTRTPEALIVKMSLKDAADLVEALQIALVPVD